MSNPKAVKKILSVNDVGKNGSHQAGMLVPKKEDILYFFPRLDGSIKNPRCTMVFIDDSNKAWKFNFIYYNNKLVEEKGTRNEYRLTGMTEYIRENNLKPNDSVILSVSDDGQYHIAYERQDVLQIKCDPDGCIKLSLSHSWTVIDI